jgi:hypothetical protein
MLMGTRLLAHFEQNKANGQPDPSVQQEFTVLNEAQTRAGDLREQWEAQTLYKRPKKKKLAVQ